MDPTSINKEISDKIDNLKYTDFSEPRGNVGKVSDKITIGWQKILSDPFPNTSEETIKELKYLANLTKNLTYEQKALVELVDKEPLDLFHPLLKKHGLRLDVEKFNKIVEEKSIIGVKRKKSRS